MVTPILLMGVEPIDCRVHSPSIARVAICVERKKKRQMYNSFRILIILISGRN